MAEEMDRHALLALIRQEFEELCKICPPEKVCGSDMKAEQKSSYIANLDSLLNHIDQHQSAERLELLRSGTTQVDLSDEAYKFFKLTLELKIPALKNAYDELDPFGAELYRFLEGIAGPSGAGGRVRITFEEGIDQVRNLIDSNADLDFDLYPNDADEILFSKLIDFSPDLWLDRVSQLKPITVKRENVQLPMHVRFRLEELFRAFIFGCWLSVLALARAILEYTLLDNLNKFGISRCWPPDRQGKERPKRLEHLVDDFSDVLPTIKEQMTRLREYGNEYMHPKRSDTSKVGLMQREQKAKDAVGSIILVAETIYRAEAKKTH